MLKLALSLSLLASLTLSECNIGCLFCDISTDTCLFCDVVNNYTLSGGSCNLAPISNCQMIDLDGNCIICDQHNYFNSVSGECEAVPGPNVISNCLYYSPEIECIICEKDYYLDSNACLAVTTPILNCDFNMSDTQCSRCSTGLTPSLDKTSCIVADEANCHGYSFIQCGSCADTHILNRNYYIDFIYKYENSMAHWMLINKLSAVEENTNDVNNYDVCHLKSVDNCKIFSTGDKCQSCDIGYFVTENDECEVNPLDDIQNCIKYASYDSCTECSNGFKLTAEDKCVGVTEINDCSVYAGDVTTDVCLLCDSNYYLDSNTCQLRNTLAVDNCDQLKVDGEGCGTCSNGFTPTDDALACLTSISNCKTYASSDETTVEHSCDECDNTYYLDTISGECTPGSVVNCKTYQTSSDVCTVCDNGYYLDGLVCEPHDALDNCITYSNATENTCTVCNNQSYLFNRSNTCAQVTPIAECKTHDTPTTCLTCNDGYYLENATTCSQIPPSEHCLQKNETDECIRCEAAYVLEGGECFEHVDNTTLYCEDNNLDGLIDHSQLRCNYCIEDSVPVNYKETYACFKNDYLQSALSITLVPDCLQYAHNGTGYICKKCGNDKLLSSGSCANTCATTMYSHVLAAHDSSGDSTNDSLHIENVNICSAAISMCAVASPDMHQPDLSSIAYVCVQCEEGKVPTIEFNSSVSIYRPNTSGQGAAVLTPVSYSLPYTCTDAAVEEKIKGELNVDGFIDNCQSYYDIEVGFGCLKCDHKYTGVVIDAIHNCAVYSSVSTCSQCKDDYYLKDNKTCLPVDSPITNCETHSTTTNTIECVKCESDYYLADSTTCTSRDNTDPNCVEYFVGDDQCKTCDTNYFLNGLVCYSKIAHCSTHQVNPTIACLGCEDGYYLFSDACIEGSVTDCFKYSQDGTANSCIECNNGKYPDNNACVDHVAIDNCDTYGQTRNKCEVCSPTYFLFSLNNKCVDVTVIDNCVDYSSLTTCRRCDIGFYVGNAAQVCNTIPDDWHCEIYGDYTPSDNNGCEACEIGYINIDGLCYNWFKFIKENCDMTHGITETGKEDKRVCSYCADDAEPEDFTDEYVCLEKTMVESWIANEATTGVFQNCRRYVYDVNTIKCIECDPGYVIYPANFKCIPENVCNNNIISIDFVTTASGSEKNLVTVTAGPTCISLPLDRVHPQDKKCYYSPSTNTNVDNDVVYYCSKCFAGYVPVVDLKSGAMVITEGIAEMVNPLETHIALADCLNPNDACVTIQGVLNLSNFVTNCEYYYTVSIRTLGCLVCKRNYSGVIKAFDTDLRDTPSVGYIESCNTEIDGCDPSVTFYGIVSHSSQLDNTLFPWHIMFNGCHKCTDPDKIPVVYIQGGSLDPYYQIQGLAEYNAADITTKVPIIGEGDGLSTVCANVSNGEVLNGITITSIAPNCALAFVNAMSTLSSSSSYVDGSGAINLNKSDFNIFCAACKEGYRAVRAEENGFRYSDVVVDCMAIANCSATVDGTWLNSCQNCNAGYAYLFDTTNDMIRFDTCSETNTDNYCLVVLSTRDCVLCKKGYKLNSFGVCELVTPPKCTTFYANEPLHYKYEQMIFYLAPKPNSCAECQSDYLPIKNFHSLNSVIVNSQIPATRNYCVTRDPHTPIVDPSIANCEATTYENQNAKPNIVLERDDCLNCVSTHIEALNGQCASKDNNPNCIKARDHTSNMCEICEAGYVPVIGVCTLLVNDHGVIDNCVEYDDPTFETGAICTKCDPEYYIDRSIVAGNTVTTCELYTGDFENCIQFNSDDLSHIYCIECSPGFALLILEGDIVAGVEGHARTCISITGYSDPDCETWDLSKQYIGQLECTKCNTFLKLVRPNDAPTDLVSSCPQISLLDNCATYDVDTALFNSITYNPTNSSLLCIECEADYYLDEINYECVSRTNYPIANCEVYTVNLDTCQSCEVNYILSVDSLTCAPTTPVNTSPAILPGSIFACRDMNDCDPNYYEGLPAKLNAITSCHKCADANKIPFVAVRAGLSYSEITGLNQFGLAVQDIDTDAFDKGTGGEAILCLEPVAASFGIDGAKFNFPDNCGIGIINTNAVPNATDANLSTGVDRTRISVFCGSCGPGYKRVIAKDTSGTTDVDLMAGSCTQIANCSHSEWFNYCTQCDVSHSYAYTPTAGVKYDECVNYPANPNCYAVDNTDTDNLSCKFCKRGYYFNLDGYCELIIPPFCDSTEFNFRKAYSVVDLAVGLYVNENGLGCQKCDSGYSAIYQEADNYLCTQSIYHSSELVDADSNYIFKCKHYYEDSGNLLCQECYSGYVVLDMTRTCVINTNLPFCVLAMTEDTCKACEEGYVPVNRICEEENIANCAVYSNDEDSTEQECAKCSSGFYLDSNACVAGSVPNCKDHETATVCNICENEYTLVTKSGGESYCYPIDPSLNCSKFDQTQIDSAVLACTQCINDDYIISTNTDLFDPTICMTFVPISNCAQYDVQTLISASTFECTECDTNFYLTGGSCEARTNFPEFCETYNPTEDKCLSCEAGYFIESTGLTCTPYPTGIQNCRIYSDADTCSACKTNTYLENNQCLDVPSGNLVDNCKYYLNDTTCSHCIADHYLDVNDCVLATASNCVTYTSANQCASCEEGFGLEDDGSGTINCVEKNVLNCVESTDTSPFSCTLCENNYYPDNGTCTSIDTAVTNCVAYDTATTCIKCAQGYALSLDQLSCLSNANVFNAIDQNCSNSFVVSDPYCSSCDLGYYFDGGACVQCPVINGCASCDAHDSSRCVMCQGGYYYNSDGDCVLNAVAEPDDEITDEDNKTYILEAICTIAIALLNIF